MKVKEVLEKVMAQGKSIQEISDDVKISFLAAQNLIDGKTKKPRTDTARAIADAYDLELKYINREPHFFEPDAYYEEETGKELTEAEVEKLKLLREIEALEMELAEEKEKNRKIDEFLENLRRDNKKKEGKRRDGGRLSVGRDR